MPVKPTLKFTAWSYSRWKDYCKCPFLAKCKHLEKLREPENPAMARGSMIHKEGENYLLGTTKNVPASFKTFAAEMRELRKLTAVPESQWAFDRKWSLVEWYASNAWCRVKTDAYAISANKGKNPAGAKVIDFKTGKPYDEHKEQLSLYAVGGFVQLPKNIEVIDAAMWYLDQGIETKKTFLRDDLLDMRKDWEHKTSPMMNDTRFAPKPGPQCPRCHYRKSNGGPCKF
jgi:hypothetical protein